MGNNNINPGSASAGGLNSCDHVVQPNETIGKIALDHRVDIEALRKFNKDLVRSTAISSGELFSSGVDYFNAGDTIYIPNQTSAACLVDGHLDIWHVGDISIRNSLDNLVPGIIVDGQAKDDAGLEDPEELYINKPK